MRFEDFQDGHLGGHLRYWNRTILAILNLYVTHMPPIKFGLNLHFSLGGDVARRISRRPSWMLEWDKFSSSESLWWPSWISERNDFSKYIMILCYSNSSHQVSALSDFQFGRRCSLKIFKMTDLAAILDIGTEWF